MAETLDEKLLAFAQVLCRSTTAEELATRFAQGFRRVMHAPMFGLYFVDQQTGKMRRAASANVSDIFLSRYERLGRAIDPLHEHVMETGCGAYNRDLMTADEWLESPLFTKVSYLHDVHQLVEAPIVGERGVVGTINFGTADAIQGYQPEDIRRAEAIGRLVGSSIEGLCRTRDLERARDVAVTALELSGIPAVITDPNGLDLDINDPAQRLLLTVSRWEQSLNGLLARRHGEGACEVQVELVSGRTAVLRGHARELPAHGGTVVTVLELHESDDRLPAWLTGLLTEREGDVARLVAAGLTDREVARELHLSTHTVSQHVKRIYRKLDVHSRVDLTRLVMHR